MAVKVKILKEVPQAGGHILQPGLIFSTTSHQAANLIRRKLAEPFEGKLPRPENPPENPPENTAAERPTAAAHAAEQPAELDRNAIIMELNVLGVKGVRRNMSTEKLADMLEMARKKAADDDD